jgi:hypothetical protein
MRSVAAIAASAVLGLVLQAGAGAASLNFPSRGIVVPGQSIGGITIGMTEQQVAQHWGHGFVVCSKCGPNLVWLYEYPGSEPLGAAVKFGVPSTTASSIPGMTTTTSSKTTTTTATTTTSGSSKPASHTATPPDGKVVAVFTLGSPTGWGAKGAMMFDPVSNVYNLFGNTGDAQCIGYDALTVRVGQNTMSFYTASGVIYGYALTAPTQSPCQ